MGVTSIDHGIRKNITYKKHEDSENEQLGINRDKLGSAYL